MKEQIHTRSFQARDQNGELYRIDVLTEYEVTLGPDGASSQRTKGAEHFFTSDGTKAERVERIDKGSYRIKNSGVELTSTDPEAE